MSLIFFNGEDDTKSCPRALAVTVLLQLASTYDSRTYVGPRGVGRRGRFRSHTFLVTSTVLWHHFGSSYEFARAAYRVPICSRLCAGLEVVPSDQQLRPRQRRTTVTVWTDAHQGRCTVAAKSRRGCTCGEQRLCSGCQVPIPAGRDAIARLASTIARLRSIEAAAPPPLLRLAAHCTKTPRVSSVTGGSGGTRTHPPGPPLCSARQR